MRMRVSSLVGMERTGDMHWDELSEFKIVSRFVPFIGLFSACH